MPKEGGARGGYDMRGWFYLDDTNVHSVLFLLDALFVIPSRVYKTGRNASPSRDQATVVCLFHWKRSYSKTTRTAAYQSSLCGSLGGKYVISNPPPPTPTPPSPCHISPLALLALVGSNDYYYYLCFGFSTSRGTARYQGIAMTRTLTSRILSRSCTCSASSTNTIQSRVQLNSSGKYVNGHPPYPHHIHNLPTRLAS